MANKEHEFVTDTMNSQLLADSSGFNIRMKLTRKDIDKLLNGKKLVIFDGYEYCTILEAEQDEKR